MSRWVFLTCFALFALAGCHRGVAAAEHAALAAKPPPVDPMEATREGMHQGAYLLGNAAQEIADAVKTAKAIKDSSKDALMKAALSDALGSLDDAGASIGDFTDMPPALDEFRANFAREDKERLDAIDGANDAIHDVNDVLDNLDSYLSDDKSPYADEMNKLSDSLGNAIDDLTDAVHGFGGKVEQDDTLDVAPSGENGATP